MLCQFEQAARDDLGQGFGAADQYAVEICRDFLVGERAAHGVAVDREGNVWVTDAVNPKRTPARTRGHQVIKFSPEGNVLLVLGTPGVPGGDETHLNSPSDVVVAANGHIFVADSDANVTAALHAGWQAHHYTDSLNLPASLRGAGLPGP